MLLNKNPLEKQKKLYDQEKEMEKNFFDAVSARPGSKVLLSRDGYDFSKTFDENFDTGYRTFRKNFKKGIAKTNNLSYNKNKPEKTNILDYENIAKITAEIEKEDLKNISAPGNFLVAADSSPAILRTSEIAGSPFLTNTQSSQMPEDTYHSLKTPQAPPFGTQASGTELSARADDPYTLNKEIYDVLKSMPEQLRRYEALGFDKSKTFDENFKNGFRFVGVNNNTEKKEDNSLPIDEANTITENTEMSQTALTPAGINSSIRPSVADESVPVMANKKSDDYESDGRRTIDACYDQFETRGNLTKEICETDDYDAVYRMQQLLRFVLDDKDIPANGVFDARTESALNRYKQSRKMGANGVLDAVTFAHLQYEYEQFIYASDSEKLAEAEKKLNTRIQTNFNKQERKDASSSSSPQKTDMSQDSPYQTIYTNGAKDRRTADAAFDQFESESRGSMTSDKYANKDYDVVYHTQQMLIALGYANNINPNGKFDKNTEAALERFKRIYGLSNEKELGALTFAYLQYVYEQMIYQQDGDKLAASNAKFESRKKKLFASKDTDSISQSTINKETGPYNTELEIVPLGLDNYENNNSDGYTYVNSDGIVSVAAKLGSDIFEFIFPGSKERGQKAFDSLYDFTNWLSFGTVDIFKETLMPETPLSLQHWLYSAESALIVIPGIKYVSQLSKGPFLKLTKKKIIKNGQTITQVTVDDYTSKVATVDELIEMGNKRVDVFMGYADDINEIGNPGDISLVEFLEKMEAEAFHELQGIGKSEILLRKDVATRWTVFHEWLHRYFQKKYGHNIENEDQIIEAFLKRHKDILKLE